MSRFDALNKLWDSVRETSHDFRQTTDIFPPFDRVKLVSSLALKEKGAERGALDQPPPTGKAFDEVEQSISAAVEDEKLKSNQVLEDQFQTYDERLRNLDFQGQFGLIQQTNSTSLSDFKAEVKTGANELHGLRKDLKIAEEELIDFKKRNSLRRAARISSGGWKFFKIALVVLLLVIETVLNGTFLAAGSERGIVGGAVEAFTFAFLNIGFALLLAIVWVRFIVHRNFLLKTFGLIGLAAYGLFAIAINLALAHYRELAEISSLAEASGAVIGRLTSAPFVLDQLSSWTLFGVGLLFSILAFFDGIFWTDPYVGFAAVQKRLNQARDHYKLRTEELVEDLREVRDEHNRTVDLIIRELSQRRREAAAIIEHRARTSKLFQEHQNHLERTANELLTIYREANRKARRKPEPSYFQEQYVLARIVVPTVNVDEQHALKMSEKIEAAQEELSTQIKRISEAFEDALTQYQQLDDIAPEADRAAP